MEINPFPAVMGRVCYHPGETNCNRVQVDDAVGINSVERFLGDEALKQGWKVAPPTERSGKHVLVIGAGPSGLSAAYHLARLGHKVTIKDAGPIAGGMMRFGIPIYRLPRDVLEAEIQRILDLGVTLELNTTVTNVLETKEEGGFDAVFLAVGAQIGKRAYIPAGSAAKIVDAVTLLHSMEGEEKPQLGRRVVVYGGVTRRSTPRAPPSASAPKRRSSSTGATARRCPLRTSRSKRRSARASCSSGSRRSSAPTRASWSWRRWSSTRRGSGSRRASSRSSRPTPSCSRSARTPTSHSSRACPGSTSRTARSRSTRT